MSSPTLPKKAQAIRQLQSGTACAHPLREERINQGGDDGQLSIMLAGTEYVLEKHRVCMVQ